MTQLKRDRPTWNTFTPRTTLLEDHVSGRVRPALFVLACAVAVVMLIVCANLSNLLVARTASRQKEMAVRAALGAGRGRLIRQMLTESLVLSGLGAVFGLALAVVATGIRLAARRVRLFRCSTTVRVDAVALAFITFAAVFTGLGVGLAPALQVPSRRDARRAEGIVARHAAADAASPGFAARSSSRKSPSRACCSSARAC